MEAAGWQVARLCPTGTAVVCGVGNNAGDGLAAARHLHRWGKLAGVCCIDLARLQGAAAQELVSLRRIGVEVASELRLEGAQAIAIDVPSGLDADTGVAYAPTVKAHTTVTLGLPKPGLLTGDGPRLAGEVWVADIGVPFEAYALLGLPVPPDLFASGDRIRLDSIR